MTIRFIILTGFIAFSSQVSVLSAWEVSTQKGFEDQIGPHKKIEIRVSEPSGVTDTVTQTNPVPPPIVMPQIIQAQPSDGLNSVLPDGMAVDLGNGEYLTSEGIYKDLGQGAYLTPEGILIRTENGAIINLPAGLPKE